MYYWCNLLSGNPLDQGKFSLLAESNKILAIILIIIIEIKNNNNTVQGSNNHFSKTRQYKVEVNGKC